MQLGQAGIKVGGRKERRVGYDIVSPANEYYRRQIQEGWNNTTFAGVEGGVEEKWQMVFHPPLWCIEGAVRK